MKNLAVIPARSGSKGLPDKNIRELCGKPLMAYTLEAAVSSGVFDEVMVSTDSERYADVARAVSGVSVPFLRSAGTSGDSASTWDAVREVLDGYGRRGAQFDMFCVLQPTSPLRTAQDIAQAYKLFVERSAYSVVSVCETGFSLNYCNTLPDDLSLVGFLRDESKFARQMSSVSYRLNGALYMCDTRTFLRYGTIYREKSFAYIMDSLHSADIDDENDLLWAEFLLSRRH